LHPKYICSEVQEEDWKVEGPLRLLEMKKGMREGKEK